jgi:hypothetical protein
MELVHGKAYYLQGMASEMWDAPHPVFGAPRALAARYIGCITGSRRWHGFEVWIENREQGVLFMNDDDLLKLRVTEIDEVPDQP